MDPAADGYRAQRPETFLMRSKPRGCLQRGGVALEEGRISSTDRWPNVVWAASTAIGGRESHRVRNAMSCRRLPRFGAACISVSIPTDAVFAQSATTVDWVLVLTAPKAMEAARRALDIDAEDAQQGLGRTFVKLLPVSRPAFTNQSLLICELR